MQFWRQSGGATSEMGEYSANAHMAAITDKQGRIMVLMTHNTDIADSWEREGDDPAVLLQLLAERLRGRVERGALRADPLRPRCPGCCAPSWLRSSLAASAAAAQEQWERFRGGGGRSRYPPRYPTATSFDGGFNFCRLDLHQRSPRSRRLRVVHRLLGRRHQFLDAPRRADQDDDQPAAGRRAEPPDRRAFRIRCSFQCPFLSATDVGTALFTDEEAETLRDYLEKGGFLWVDDFWGPYAWDNWVSNISKVLPPGEYPIRDIAARPSDPPDAVRVHGAAADSVDQLLAAMRRRDLGALRAERRAALPRHRRRAGPPDGGDDATTPTSPMRGSGKARTRSSSSASRRRATRSASTSCCTG